jgi:hypothetical protein
MWVPPGTAAGDVRLRAFQFRNQSHQIVVMSGPTPSVSVSTATVDAPKHQVYTSDVENDYDGRTSNPRIPRFIALWCCYIASIAPSLGVREIQIANVANTYLGRMLNRLGFLESPSVHFTAQIATMTPKVQAEVQGVGWTIH